MRGRAAGEQRTPLRDLPDRPRLRPRSVHRSIRSRLTRTASSGTFPQVTNVTPAVLRTPSITIVYRCGAAVGLIGAGSAVAPIRNRSDRGRGGAALGDRPDDQRLAAAHVAGDEHAGHRRLRSRRPRATLPRSVNSTPRSVSRPSLLRADETHRQQHQVGLEFEVACPRPSRTCRPTSRPRAPCSAGDVAVPADELLGVDREHALAALFVRRGHPEHQRVGRPRGGVGARLRRARHDLELVHAGRALPVRRCPGSRRRCRRRR